MKYLHRLQPWLCTAVVIVGLLEFLCEKNIIFAVCGGAVVLLALILLFPRITTYARVVALVLCGSSLLAFFLFKMPPIPGELVGGFTEMASLVAVMAAVNILGIPLRLGKYAGLFQRFFVKAKRPSQPYIISLLITYVLSFLSLAGAVGPAYYLIRENLQKLGLGKNSRLEATSVARGYAMALIVSPVAATVGITVKYSGLSWKQLIGPVFLLSLAGLLAAFFMEVNQMKGPLERLPNQAAGDPEIHLETAKVAPRRLAGFLFLFSCVIGITLFLQDVLHFSSLNGIALGCLTAAFIWGAVSGRLTGLGKHSFTFFSRDVIKMADQTTLFAAAGFFTYAMEASGALKLVGSLLELVAGRVGIVFILVTIPLFIVLLAFIGLHPFVSAIIIAKTLQASPFYFHPLGLAMALVGGLAMSFMLSPFSISVLILSSLTGNSPYKLGFRWNSAFAAVFWGLTALFIIVATKLA